MSLRYNDMSAPKSVAPERYSPEERSTLPPAGAGLRALTSSPRSDAQATLGSLQEVADRFEKVMACLNERIQPFLNNCPAVENGADVCRADKHRRSEYFGVAQATINRIEESVDRLEYLTGKLEV